MITGAEVYEHKTISRQAGVTLLRIVTVTEIFYGGLKPFASIRHLPGVTGRQGSQQN
jgi:hypothetical protein